MSGRGWLVVGLSCVGWLILGVVGAEWLRLRYVAWLSLGLILAGTWLAARSLWSRREHNPELFSSFDRGWQWVRRAVFRQRGREVPAAVGSGAGVVSVVGTGRGYAVVPETAPLEDQVRFLRAWLKDVHEEMTERVQALQASVRDVRHLVGEVSSEAVRRDAETRKELVKVSTGSTPRELSAVLLIGLGSILSLWA